MTMSFKTEIVHQQREIAVASFLIISNLFLFFLRYILNQTIRSLSDTIWHWFYHLDNGFFQDGKQTPLAFRD